MGAVVYVRMISILERFEWLERQTVDDARLPISPNKGPACNVVVYVCTRAVLLMDGTLYLSITSRNGALIRDRKVARVESLADPQAGRAGLMSISA